MKVQMSWGPKIALQFAVIVLPLLLLLSSLTLGDRQRAAELATAFPQHMAANAARKHYKVFVDGMVDAVDTGQLSATALKALQTSQQHLGHVSPSLAGPGVQALASDMAQFASALSASARLETLLPLRERIGQVNDGLQKLDEQFEREMVRTIEDSQTSARNQTHLTVIVACLSVLLSLFFVRNQIVRLTSPLRKAIGVARAISDGDLTQAHRVPGTDETAQLLNALKDMADALCQSVGEVQRASEGIQASSNEIANVSSDLSDRAQIASVSLQQTAGNVAEISRAVGETAEHAAQASDIAATAASVAQKGGQLIGDVVATMDEIEASSKKVSDIIGVIDGIAFQTNILALNAAVEAARAGEQGKGFAVVASEVRSLAMRSAGAARQIKDLIGDSVAKVETGTHQVGLAGNTMKDVVEHVQRASALIAEISAAARLQTTNLQEVGIAVGELDAVTHRNAELVGVSSDAADTLRSQASDLGDLVQVFKVQP